MMDLEQLDEALEKFDAGGDGWPRGWSHYHGTIVDAARACRDLLANGAEPEYEAAAEILYESRPEVTSGRWPHWRDLRSATRSLYLTNVRAVVDAAIGDRLLVDYPKEAENE